MTSLVSTGACREVMCYSRCSVFIISCNSPIEMNDATLLIPNTVNVCLQDLNKAFRMCGFRPGYRIEYGKKWWLEGKQDVVGERYEGRRGESIVCS